MASEYWVKLYHEILHDPKMGRLSDRAWRRVVELYLLAGENDGTGNIPDTADLAWTLRADTDELEAELQELTKIDVVRKTETGWFVVHFAARQAPSSSTERSRRYRDKKQREQYRATTPQDAQRECNANATNCELESDADADADADAESESDADADAERLSSSLSPSGGPDPEPWPEIDPLIKLLNDHGVMPSSQIASESWRDLLEMAGSEHLFGLALQEAVDSGKQPSPRYVRKTLQRCKRENCLPGQWPNSRKGSRASPKKDPVPYGPPRRRKHPITGEMIDPTKAAVNG